MELTYNTATVGSNLSTLAVPTAPKAKDTRVAAGTVNKNIPKSWTSMIPDIISAGVKGYGMYMDSEAQKAKIASSNIINNLDKTEAIYNAEQMNAFESGDTEEIAKWKDTNSSGMKLQRTATAYTQHIDYLDKLENVRDSDKEALKSNFNSVYNSRVKKQQAAVLSEFKKEYTHKVNTNLNAEMRVKVATSSFKVSDLEPYIKSFESLGYSTEEANSIVYKNLELQIENIYDNKEALKAIELELNPKTNQDETKLDTKVDKLLAGLRKQLDVTIAGKIKRDKTNAKIRLDNAIGSGTFNKHSLENLQDMFLTMDVLPDVQFTSNSEDGSWDINDPITKEAFNQLIMKNEDAALGNKYSLQVSKAISRGDLIDMDDLDGASNKKVILESINEVVSTALDDVLAGDKGASLRTLSHYMQNDTVNNGLQSAISGKLKDSLSLLNSKETEGGAIPSIIALWDNMPVELQKGLNDSNREYFNLASIVKDNPGLLNGLKDIYRNSDTVEDARDTLDGKGYTAYKDMLEEVEDDTVATKYFNRVYKLTKDYELAAKKTKETYGTVDAGGIELSRPLNKELEEEAKRSGDARAYKDTMIRGVVKYVRDKSGFEDINSIRILQDGNHINIHYNKEVNDVEYPGSSRLLKEDFNGILDSVVGSEPIESNIQKKVRTGAFTSGGLWR